MTVRIITGDCRDVLRTLRAWWRSEHDHRTNER